MKQRDCTINDEIFPLLDELYSELEMYNKKIATFCKRIDNITKKLEDDSNKLNLLKNSLRLQKMNGKAALEMINYTGNIICPELKKYKYCEWCNQYYIEENMYRLSGDYNEKLICDGCFENNFFICNKCEKIFPISEIEEGDPPFAICKECCKPIGFPSTVCIAPDFPYCDGLVFSSKNALDKYLANQYNMITDDRDVILIEFYKEDDHGNMIYKSDYGALYIVEELDHDGCGCMKEQE